MKVHNFRLGFASNSSSTHSVWLVDDPKKITELLYSYCFGWEDFVLTTKPEIDLYVAAQLKEHFREFNIPEYVQIAILKYLFSQLPEDVIQKLEIDHQSQWLLPRYINTNSSFPPLALVEDIINYLHKKNVIILGGNDNENDDVDALIPGPNKQEDPNFQKLLSFSNGPDWICLKDNVYWKFFNKRTGAKIRFSLDDVAQPYSKSSAPELVDLIVSNQCSQNCGYCYRGCTKNGAVAPIHNVIHYIEALSELNVFEVAIGGGDLLTYPNLSKLLSYLAHMKHNFDIVFNTTLRDWSYYDYQYGTLPYWEQVHKCLDVFSGVAFSVKSAESVTHIIKYCGKYLNKISLNIIPELMPQSTLKELLEIADQFNLSCTYLGFKNTGRASTLSPYYQNLLNENHKEDLPQLLYEWRKSSKRRYNTHSVDTQFIKNFPSIENLSEDWMFTKEEGKFSCCIDATTDRIAVSSYDNNSKPIRTTSHNGRSDELSRQEIKESILKYYPEF